MGAKHSTPAPSDMPPKTEEAPLPKKNKLRRLHSILFSRPRSKQIKFSKRGAAEHSRCSTSSAKEIPTIDASSHCDPTPDHPRKVEYETLLSRYPPPSPIPLPGAVIPQRPDDVTEVKGAPEKVQSTCIDEDTLLDVEYEQIPVMDDAILDYIDSDEDGISLSQHIPGIGHNILKQYQDDFHVMKHQRPKNLHYIAAHIRNRSREAQMAGRPLEISGKEKEYLEREQRRYSAQGNQNLARCGMDIFMARHTTPEPQKKPKTQVTHKKSKNARRKLKMTHVEVFNPEKPCRELPAIVQHVEDELKGLFKMTPKKTKVVPLGYGTSGSYTSNTAVEGRTPASSVAPLVIIDEGRNLPGTVHQDP